MKKEPAEQTPLGWSLKSTHWRINRCSHNKPLRLQTVPRSSISWSVRRAGHGMWLQSLNQGSVAWGK